MPRERRGRRTVVVDNGSSDGTVGVRARALPRVRVVRAGEPRPRRRLEPRHRGDPPSRWVLLLNADAWLAGDALGGWSRRRRAPRAAVVAPRLLNPDGTLQRSVRGFPTLWRLATEYFFLRKLGTRTELLNAFYGGGFDHAASARSSS